MVEIVDKNSVIILDGHYMEKMSKSGRGKYLKIDFSRFKDIVCPDYICTKMFYYHCTPYNGDTTEEKNRYIDKVRFFRALETIRNCHLRIGELQRVIKNKEVFYFRKQIEIFMTIDMMRIALTGQYDNVDIDRVYFVSSNANMMPVIKILMNSNVKVIHVHCENMSISENFINEFSDSIKIVNDELENICL